MTLKKGNLIDTIDLQKKAWSLELDVKPTGTVSEWSNVIYLTIGAHYENYGDRTPAIWFPTNSNELFIDSAVNGNLAYGYKCKELPRDVFTNVKVTQTLISKNHYKFAIAIEGDEVHSVINNNALEFENVKIYASNPWQPPAKAIIKNVKFSNLE